MPLSEHEQRMLDEMERNLYGVESDVHPARERSATPNYSAMVWGVLIGLAGLGVIIMGVMMQLILVGIAGFVIMFLGTMVATRRAKPSASDGSATGSAGSSGSGSSKSSGRSGMTFMQRMEKRWDDRQ